jgi:hypothetical protein
LPMSSLELMSFLALLMIFLGPIIRIWDSEPRNIKSSRWLSERWIQSQEKMILPLYTIK